MKLADPGKLDGAGGRGCIDGVPESLRRFSFSGNGAPLLVGEGHSTSSLGDLSLAATTNSA